VGYFNTFGGSAVAAAVGQAVLDVIEREDLMGNALRVGSYLKEGLQKLRLTHSTLLEVRGAGLYVGVQVSTSGVAAAIINSMRERRVLIGAAGLNGEVLKVRPPLCFTTEHAELLLSALDESLSALENG
jgi:4-aminobutyrate aminotransferase-like enzyme